MKTKTWCVLQIIHPPPLSTSSYYLDMSAFLLSLVVQNKVCNPFIFSFTKKNGGLLFAFPIISQRPKCLQDSLKKEFIMKISRQAEEVILEQKKVYFHWWELPFHPYLISTQTSSSFNQSSLCTASLSSSLACSLLRSEWALIYLPSVLNNEKKWGGNLRHSRGE